MNRLRHSSTVVRSNQFYERAMHSIRHPPHKIPRRSWWLYWICVSIESFITIHMLHVGNVPWPLIMVESDNKRRWPSVRTPSYSAVSGSARVATTDA